ADYRGTVSLCHPEPAKDPSSPAQQGSGSSPPLRMTIGAQYTFTAADAGSRRFEGVDLDGPTATIVVRDQAAGLEAESNPCLVEPAAPELAAFWGDLHGQSGETIGT